LDDSGAASAVQLCADYQLPRIQTILTD